MDGVGDSRGAQAIGHLRMGRKSRVSKLMSMSSIR
jgi:hypothetical protein